MVDGGCRRDRGRAAVLRPGDGRPDDPGRRRASRSRPACAPATSSGSSRRAPPGVPTLVMTYWNPVERYGVERFAADLAVGRRGRAHHARPDPRTRPASGSLRQTRTTSTRCSSSRRRRRTARLAQHDRRTAAASSTRPPSWASRVRASRRATLAPSWCARTREVTDLPVGVGLGVSHGRPGRRGRGVRRRASSSAARSSRRSTRRRPTAWTRRPGPSTALARDLARGVRREL